MNTSFDTSKQQLYEILAIAAEFYRQMLYRQQGSMALAYLKSERGFSDETIQSFQLGYAPAGWEDLSNFLVERKNFSPQAIVSAGLTIARKDGNSYYDRFRDRLMIPICDLQGRVIGFGGRTLSDEQPKYLNSPETELFDKGNTLYGLDRAKDAISKTDRAIVVEGFFDVIALHAAGIDSAVAALGTALSLVQVKQLVEFTASKQIVLNFDADKAGNIAAERAIGEVTDLAYQGQLQLRILNLPTGKDADEFLKSHTQQDYLDLLDRAALWLDWQIDKAVENQDLVQSDLYQAVVLKIIKLLKKISDETVRAHYLKKSANLLSNGDSYMVPLITESLQKTIKSEAVLTVKSNLQQTNMALKEQLLETTDFLAHKERRNAEDVIIDYLLANPGEIGDIKRRLKPQCFAAKETRIVYNALIEMHGADLEIEVMTLEIYLSQQNLLEAVGGTMGLMTIVDGSIVSASPSKKSLNQAVKYLVELDKRSRLAQKTAKLRHQLLDLSQPHAKVSSIAVELLEDFLDNSDPETTGLAPIANTIQTTADEIIKRTLDRRAGVSAISISTGFYDLDKHMGGLFRGDFIVLGARPRMGKSALSAQLCLNVAKQNHPCAFFSLEMTTAQLNSRCLSIEAEINSEAIRDGYLTDRECSTIKDAATRLATLNYWGTDQFATSIDFVVAESRKLAAKQGQLGLIVVDYIQLMILDQGNSVNEVSNISRKLKSLAIELNCTVIGLSQLSRGVESRNDKRPVDSDLRDSGTLEQDPDIIWMLYRDIVYNPDTPDPKATELLVRKFRNGRQGTVMLSFDGATTQFKNYQSQND